MIEMIPPFDRPMDEREIYNLLEDLTAGLSKNLDPTPFMVGAWRIVIKIYDERGPFFNSLQVRDEDHALHVLKQLFQSPAPDLEIVVQRERSGRWINAFK